MSRYTRVVFVLLFVSVAAGCGSTSDVGPRGLWGGLTLEMDLTDGGGAVVMCCGQAKLDQPVMLDDAGAFAVTGTVTASPYYDIGQRLRYFGSVSGNTMTIRAEILVAPFAGNPEYWFPVGGPEGSDSHFILHPGVTGTFQHPDGTGACACTNPMNPPGQH